MDQPFDTTTMVNTCAKRGQPDDKVVRTMSREIKQVRAGDPGIRTKHFGGDGRKAATRPIRQPPPVVPIYFCSNLQLPDRAINSELAGDDRPDSLAALYAEADN